MGSREPEAKWCEDHGVIVHRTHDVELASWLAYNLLLRMQGREPGQEPYDPITLPEPACTWLRARPANDNDDFSFWYEPGQPGQRGAFRCVEFSEKTPLGTPADQDIRRSSTASAETRGRATRAEEVPLGALLRTPGDVNEVCAAAGLEQDVDNGNWLAANRSFGVGVARLGPTLLGAEVALPPPHEGAEQRGLVRVFPDAPAALLAHAIDIARKVADGQGGANVGDAPW
uniref:hypothetical protein n=1 Tax=Pseudonocardia sp. CA-138482 TaxID=3240023 RepID=UPI003F493C96